MKNTVKPFLVVCIVIALLFLGFKERVKEDLKISNLKSYDIFILSPEECEISICETQQLTGMLFSQFIPFKEGEQKILIIRDSKKIKEFEQYNYRNGFPVFVFKTKFLDEKIKEEENAKGSGDILRMTTQSLKDKLIKFNNEYSYDQFGNFQIE